MDPQSPQAALELCIPTNICLEGQLWLRCEILSLEEASTSVFQEGGDTGLSIGFSYDKQHPQLSGEGGGLLAAFPKESTASAGRGQRGRCARCERQLWQLLPHLLLHGEPCSAGCPWWAPRLWPLLTTTFESCSHRQPVPEANALLHLGGAEQASPPARSSRGTAGPAASSTRPDMARPGERGRTGGPRSELQLVGQDTAPKAQSTWPSVMAVQITLGSKGLKQSGVVPTWWDSELGSWKQGWDAEEQWTRVARPWLRSAYCALLQSLGRKEGDPSGSLGQGGGWGCGAKEFSHGLGGGRCIRLGGGHRHAGVLLHVSPDVWSSWRCRSWPRTGRAAPGKVRQGRGGLSGILCSSSQDRTLIPYPQPQVPFTVTEQLRPAPPTTWAFCSITGHSLLRNKAQSQCMCPAA